MKHTLKHKNDLGRIKITIECDSASEFARSLIEQAEKLIDKLRLGVEGGSALLMNSVGPSYVLIIKAVRNATGLGLKEAKDLVDRARTLPTCIKTINNERLTTLHRELEILECGVQILGPSEALVYGVMSE